MTTLVSTSDGFCPGILSFWNEEPLEAVTTDLLINREEET